MWTKNSAYYLMPLSIFIRTLFFFNYVLSSVIKCSSMMRKSRRAVWIWCCVDCLQNFLWDYLQLFLVCSTFILICNISEFPLIYLLTLCWERDFKCLMLLFILLQWWSCFNYVWTYENCLWFYMQPSEPIICFPALFFLLFFLWPANLHFITSAKNKIK